MCGKTTLALMTFLRTLCVCEKVEKRSVVHSQRSKFPKRPMRIHLLCIQFAEILMAHRIFFMICSRVSREKYPQIRKLPPSDRLICYLFSKVIILKFSHVLKTVRNCTLGARLSVDKNTFSTRYI